MKILNINATKIAYYVDAQRDDGEIVYYRTQYDAVNWDILVDGEWKPVEDITELRKKFFDFYRDPMMGD